MSIHSKNQLKHLVNGNSLLSMQNNGKLSEWKRNMVGLEEFESSSIAPEATSLDQASRQPLFKLSRGFLQIHKIMLA